jgi:hypothetical protein
MLWNICEVMNVIDTKVPKAVPYHKCSKYR